jgi:hypothetical protein
MTPHDDHHPEWMLYFDGRERQERQRDFKAQMEGVPLSRARGWKTCRNCRAHVLRGKFCPLCGSESIA